MALAISLVLRRVHLVNAGEPLFPRMVELPERIQTALQGALPDKAQAAADKAEAKKKNRRRKWTRK